MRKQKRSDAPMGKRVLILIMVLVLGFTGLMPGSRPLQAEAADSSVEKWGVFIGECIHGNRAKVQKYKYVVIDAQFYTKNEIKRLKLGGKKIYSYLSIGSLGSYRGYFNTFKKYLMGDYDNWSEEQWVDVSKKPWQDFIINKLVTSFQKKGIDGVWIDNTDVYYEYPTKAIFNGLVKILKRIRNKNLPIFINGGDVFVSELLDSGNKKLIKGIMQEEVLTRIANYDKSRFAIQLLDDRRYFMEYCRRVKKAGLSVALLEYSKNAYVKKVIRKFCKKNGYTVYIANNVQLY